MLDSSGPAAPGSEAMEPSSQAVQEEARKEFW
jgi:hypothetical protein